MNVLPVHAAAGTQPAHSNYLGPHEGAEQIEVSVVLRRRSGVAAAAAAWPERPRFARADFGLHCGADPQDLESLRRFAQQHALRETGADPRRRVLHLQGYPQQLQQAFAVRLGRYQAPPTGEVFTGCDREARLPPEALAVLGLDARPVARPPLRRPRTPPRQSYTPLEVAALYDFPPGDGSGQAVAIIELGGGFSSADLARYFSSLGIRTPSVSAVPVAGASNAPGGAADGEVMLDLEVIGALVPGANLAVYFAPNTDRGFYEAVSQAAHDAARQNTVMSISWGGPEDTWSAQARTALHSALQDAAALGVTVTVASGDGGSADGENDGAAHVDFPASSPAVLACGGTQLLSAGAVISSEVVWNEIATGEGATGGGVSGVFALPAWQQHAGVPRAANRFQGRGVPDVAGNADPMTGYQVLIDGSAQVIGGTSAVAPLWATLVARCNQQLGRPLGDLHAALYQLPDGAFRDITEGNNGAYSAQGGWDACTGRGTPRGQAMLAALAALKR